jgi:very-short-patch-repair endonuclease
LGADGYPRYFLDMGWEDPKLAVEYDGEQHRLSREQFVRDIERLEYIQRIGWTHGNGMSSAAFSRLEIH